MLNTSGMCYENKIVVVAVQVTNLPQLNNNSTNGDIGNVKRLLIDSDEEPDDTLSYDFDITESDADDLSLLWLTM